MSRVTGLVAVVLLSGCISVPAQRVDVDRLDYGEVVAESWKRQTLLNVVRLRYADAPVFLDIASIINSYSIAARASAGASFRRNDLLTDVIDVGADGTWSNTPTVTYQPLLGDRFTKSLLQPIPPLAVFQLLQSGWRADMVLLTVVGSINGLRNASAGVAQDAEFQELMERITRIQRAGDIGVRVEPETGGATAAPHAGVVVVLGQHNQGPALSEDSRRVRELLDLDTDASEFRITYGVAPESRREIALNTRSMMEIMLQLGFGVDVPDAHRTEGRVSPGQWRPGDPRAAPLVRIRSGAQAPVDAYTAVPYRDLWYWIDDTDLASKQIFTFLMILFSLAETGQSASAPVVTVPSR